MTSLSNLWRDMVETNQRELKGWKIFAWLNGLVASGAIAGLLIILAQR